MDYNELTKKKEEEEGDLIKRMDEDKDLLYLEKYIMRDATQKGNAIPDIVNVTLNRPALFAANVESALGKTTEQIVVESEVKDFDTAYIEDFVRAGFSAANERLIKQAKPQLNPFLDEQFCIRGRGAERILFRMENEVLITDIAGWDTKYVRYEVGVEGLGWASYKTRRSQAAIEAEYGIVISNKKGEVLDVWDTEHNEVWVEGFKILEQEHLYGFTPVVIRVVTLGSMLADEDSISHQGESIFFLVRTMIPELNRLCSIMQTLNLKAVKPPMKQKIRGKGHPSEYEDATGSGTITRMEPDEDIARIDYGDAQRSANLAYGMLDKAIQEGTLSSFDLGTFSQPMSAVALIQIGEGRDQVFAPRLGARGMMNQQAADMFTRQVIQIGGNVELGTSGHKKSFSTSKLKGEYEVVFKYFVKSPQIDAGLYSLAAAAGNLIPEKAKREEILQREDPDGDMKQLRWEEAEMLSPAVKMNRIVNSLIEQGEDLEAEILSAEMGMTIKQVLSGEVSQMPKPEDADLPTQVTPMFGGQGGATKPRPIEMEE